MNDNNLNTTPNYQNNFNPQYPKQNNQPGDFQQPNYYNSQQNYQQTIPPQQPIQQTPYPQYQDNQNMYQYQNQYMYSPYLQQQQQQQPKKSAFILSTIGFIMGCFALLTAFFLVCMMISESSFIRYEEHSILFSLFSILSMIGMYSQLPGLVCSIIGRILSGKMYQIKQEKSKLFSILGIIFCAICIVTTMAVIIWFIYGIMSVYSGYRY